MPQGPGRPAGGLGQVGPTITFLFPIIMLLQVEETNTAAAKLYEALGYERIHRDDNAFALRLSPGAGSLASALLLSGDEELLQPVQSELVTMAKQVSN